jgi:hypothetical protein
MSRLHPIPYGATVLLVPEFCAPPTPKHDHLLVRPARRNRGFRRG